MAEMTPDLSPAERERLSHHRPISFRIGEVEYVKCVACTEHRDRGWEDYPCYVARLRDQLAAAEAARREAEQSVQNYKASLDAANLEIGTLERVTESLAEWLKNLGAEKAAAEADAARVREHLEWALNLLSYSRRYAFCGCAFPHEGNEPAHTGDPRPDNTKLARRFREARVALAAAAPEKVE